MATNGRIIVQCDWEYVLKEKGGKAWVAFRKPGKPSIYGELKSAGLNSNNTYDITNITDGFTAEPLSQKCLQVAFQDESYVNKFEFQAASVVYTDIHKAKKNVWCLDVTPGGLGVSSDSDGKVLLWTTHNGEVRRELVGHYGDVYACRFFPSGIVVLTGGADTQIKIWSAENAECAATLKGHKLGISDLGIIDRGRNIVSVSRDGTAKLWDCGQSACLATFDNIDGGIINGCWLGTCTDGVDLGNPDTTPGEREVSTDGKLLLLACENNVFKGFGLQSRKKVFEVECSAAVNCCTALSDTLVICGTADSTVVVTDLRKTSAPVATFKESRSAILSMQPAKQGCFITTGDGSCYFLDDQLSCRTEMTGPDCDPVYRAATDGSCLFTSCRDGAIRKYRL